MHMLENICKFKKRYFTHECLNKFICIVADGLHQTSPLIFFFICFDHRLPRRTKTATLNSTGCLTAAAESAMTVATSSPHSVDDITVGSAGRSSAASAATKSSQERSSATKVP